MIDKIINQIYSNIIDFILNDIDDKDKEEVAKSYMDYLYLLYSDKEINENNYEKMLSVIMNLEKQKWTSRDKNSKLYYFKDDNSFDTISNLSKKAYSLAQEKLQRSESVISKEEAKKYIDDLISLSDKVEDFNKAEADRLVSEGILDFEYASGSHDDITSFRIGHLKK